CGAELVQSWIIEHQMTEGAPDICRTHLYLLHALTACLFHIAFQRNRSAAGIVILLQQFAGACSALRGNRNVRDVPAYAGNLAEAQRAQFAKKLVCDLVTETQPF